MTISALIVDDEEFSRQSLFYLLEENCSMVKVSGIASSVAEAKSFLSSNAVDLIFLDIAMPKENGFELLPHLPKDRSAVIFITAYDQYALRALKASAVDYLLKPINIDELKIAVTKATDWKKTHKVSREKKQPALKVLQDNMTEKNLTKLTIQHSQGFHIVEVQDIMYIEADSNYSMLYLQSGEVIVATKSLKEFEEILQVSSFVRIHKSIILNLNFLKNYSNANGLCVKLNNNQELPVSRRRYGDFTDKLQNFFKKQ
ncbi:MAG TPA: LytTR family DNA-binding domain-containing protein [Sphingobacteriaceae bacterium]